MCFGVLPSLSGLEHADSLEYLALYHKPAPEVGPGATAAIAAAPMPSIVLPDDVHFPRLRVLKLAQVSQFQQLP